MYILKANPSLDDSNINWPCFESILGTLRFFFFLMKNYLKCPILSTKKLSKNNKMCQIIWKKKNSQNKNNNAEMK